MQRKCNHRVWKASIVKTPTIFCYTKKENDLLYIFTQLKIIQMYNASSSINPQLTIFHNSKTSTKTNKMHCSIHII